MKRLAALLGLSLLTLVRGGRRARRAALARPRRHRRVLPATVPQPVYAASRRDDLGDVRIFNGAGEPVPYSLDAPTAAAPAVPPKRTPVHWVSAAAHPRRQRQRAARRDGRPRRRAARRSHRTGACEARRGSSTTCRKRTARSTLLLVHVSDDSYQGRVAVRSQRRPAQLAAARQHATAEGGPRRRDAGAGTYRARRRGAALPAARLARRRTRDRVDRSTLKRIRATHGTDTAVPRQWRDAVRVRAGATPGSICSTPTARIRSTACASTCRSRTPWRARRCKPRATRSAVARRRGRRAVPAGGKTGEHPPLEFANTGSRVADRRRRMRNGGFGGGQPAVTAIGGIRPRGVRRTRHAAVTLGVGDASLVSSAVSRDACWWAWRPKCGPRGSAQRYRCRRSRRRQPPTQTHRAATCCGARWSSRSACSARLRGASRAGGDTPRPRQVTPRGHAPPFFMRRLSRVPVSFDGPMHNCVQSSHRNHDATTCRKLSIV